MFFSISAGASSGVTLSSGGNTYVIDSISFEDGVTGDSTFHSVATGSSTAYAGYATVNGHIATDNTDSVVQYLYDFDISIPLRFIIRPSDSISAQNILDNPERVVRTTINIAAPSLVTISDSSGGSRLFPLSNWYFTNIYGDMMSSAGSNSAYAASTPAFASELAMSTANNHGFYRYVLHTHFSYVSDEPFITANFKFDYSCFLNGWITDSNDSSAPLSGSVAATYPSFSSNYTTSADSNNISDIKEEQHNFFSTFFDNLIHVFVPEDGYFSEWFQKLNDLLADKLGFLYAPFDFIITLLNAVYSDSGTLSDGIPFPGIKWEDTWIVEPQTVSLTNIGGESFSELRDAIYFGTDVILLFAFISLLHRKLNLILRGSEE